MIFVHLLDFVEYSQKVFSERAVMATAL